MAKRPLKGDASEGSSDSLAFLTGEVSRFAKVRGWGRFHTPKNLAMSVAIEAGELMEEFQWQSPAESLKKARGAQKEQVADEAADVAILLLRLAEVSGIDLGRAVLAKLEKNGKKYPVRLVKGKPHKYTYYLAKNRGARR